MVKRPLTLLLAAALACGATACHKSTPAQDAAAVQKAFRDKQRLTLIKVYDDLAKKYPDSAHAAAAKERARILREQAGLKTATPAAK